MRVVLEKLTDVVDLTPHEEQLVLPNSLDLDQPGFEIGLPGRWSVGLGEALPDMDQDVAGVVVTRDSLEADIAIGLSGGAGQF